MKLYTISSGRIEESVNVATFTLKSGDVKIPAIIIGEYGRGRSQGILPVSLLPDQYKLWQETGSCQINFGKMTVTKSGNPKLMETKTDETPSKFLCIFRTMIGFRGGNTHTGDVNSKNIFIPIPDRIQDVNSLVTEGLLLEKNKAYTKEEADLISNQYIVKRYPDVVCDHWMFKQASHFNFPGEILVSGEIAQGDAGRMGCGEQIIALMEYNKVFRTAYSGRLYGSESEHFYYHDGEKLMVATAKERKITEIF